MLDVLTNKADSLVKGTYAHREEFVQFTKESSHRITKLQQSTDQKIANLDAKMDDLQQVMEQLINQAKSDISKDKPNLANVISPRTQARHRHERRKSIQSNRAVWHPPK